MQRLVERALAAWAADSRRKPLVVRGARQVGKTHSITAFGASRFAELVVVDLERNRSGHRIFTGDLDAARLLSELRVLTDRDIAPGRTLLFLDEIQACPRAITALRYLYEECPELHVVAAGSLLEFALPGISFPVGRVQFLDMRPLTFAEYLTAVGKERAADVVTAPPRKLDDAVHAMLLDQLRDYLFVGGMPEAVRAFAETRSLRDAFAVQRELCDGYRHDFPKYAPRSDPQCLDAVFAGVARHVGQPIKYVRLAEGFSGPTIKNAFELLVKARVATRVAAASPAGLPLGASTSQRKFKALMVDVGLLQHLRGVPAATERAKTDLLAIHEGAIAEQFVGQEMLVSQGEPLHYWARGAKSSSAEVDYLAVVDGAILPVEVKSGAAGRLRSLHVLLQSFPDCPRGLVFLSRPFAELPEQKLTFLPLYYAHAATEASARG